MQVRRGAQAISLQLGWQQQRGSAPWAAASAAARRARDRGCTLRPTAPTRRPPPQAHPLRDGTMTLSGAASLELAGGQQQVQRVSFKRDSYYEEASSPLAGACGGDTSGGGGISRGSLRRTASGKRAERVHGDHHDPSVSGRGGPRGRRRRAGGDLQLALLLCCLI